jgi:hypothetical protein
MSLQWPNLGFYKDLKSHLLFGVSHDTQANNVLLDASSIQVCMVWAVYEVLLGNYRFEVLS